MKFRKFFKDKDSLNVSILSEKRHYMDYSGIEKDKFPAPLPVLNVLDSVSPKIQPTLFAWILGEGLRLASVARRDLAEWASAYLSKKYGRPVEIPQKAIFSREAAQEIPELSAEWPGKEGSGISAQDYLEKIWMQQRNESGIGGEPDEVKIGRTIVPLAQINAYLHRQGKTPLLFGGKDGLMEYIEKGDWRSEPNSKKAYPDSSITKYGKKGIELALDPGEDGLRTLENGRQIVALGRDPGRDPGRDQGKKYASVEFNVIATKEDRKIFGDMMAGEGFYANHNNDGTQVIFYNPEKNTNIVYDIVKDGEGNIKWVKASGNVHSGSYVVSNAGNPEWAEWLDSSRRESFRKIKQIYNDIKSGKDISDKDNYLAKMLKDGSITDEDFETVSAKMQKVIGIKARGISPTKESGSATQLARGSGPNDTATDEEWLKYKAVAKTHIMNILSVPPTDTQWGTFWGERAGIKNPVIKVSKKTLSGGASVRAKLDKTRDPLWDWQLDLNDPKYVGYTDDKAKREAIADELIEAMFDDENKMIRTRTLIYRKPFKDYRDKPTAHFYSTSKDNLSNILNNYEVAGRRSDKELASHIEKGWKTKPSVEPSQLSSLLQIRMINPENESDHVDFIRKDKDDLWMQIVSANDVSVNYKGKTERVKANDIFSNLLDSEHTVLNFPGIQFNSKTGKPLGEEEIQKRMSAGFVPSYLGLHNDVLQLRNKNTEEEMLFYIRNKNGKTLYYPVSSPKQTTIQNPFAVPAWPSVNTGAGFSNRIAGKNAGQEFEYFLKNPEKYGTTTVQIDNGGLVPKEVAEASTKANKGIAASLKPQDILNQYYNETLRILASFIGDIQFRFGSLENLTNNLTKALSTPCKNCKPEGKKKGSENCEVCNGEGFIPPDIKEINTLQDFIEKHIYEGQGKVKEMTGSEKLNSVLSSKGSPVAGIDEDGSVVLTSDIYNTLLLNGRKWRMVKAEGAFSTAINKEIDYKQFSPGGGGGDSEEGGQSAIDNLADDSEPVGFGDDSESESDFDPDEFLSDDEKEDQLGRNYNNDDDEYQSGDDEDAAANAAADLWLKSTQKKANVSQINPIRNQAQTHGAGVRFNADLVNQIPNASEPEIGGMPKLQSVPAKKPASPKSEIKASAPIEMSREQKLKAAHERFAQIAAEMSREQKLKAAHERLAQIAAEIAAEKKRANENFSSFQQWIVESCEGVKNGRK